jgi:hypothetical protein
MTQNWLSFTLTLSSRPSYSPPNLSSRASGYFAGTVQGVARRQLDQLYVRAGTPTRVGEWRRRPVLEHLLDRQGGGWCCGSRIDQVF